MTPRPAENAISERTKDNESESSYNITKHVYRKLRVNNRCAAVTLAKALGLLTAT